MPLDVLPHEILAEVVVDDVEFILSAAKDLVASGTSEPDASLR
jgi:hypothetical protein